MHDERATSLAPPPAELTATPGVAPAELPVSASLPSTSVDSAPASAESAEMAAAPAASVRTCLNCDAALTGPYCAECGQREAAPEATFRELFAEAWDALVSVDGKLLMALRTLVLKPGELTVDYMTGRRARYLTPLRLYLVCSLAFFVVSSATPDKGDYVRITPGGTTVSISAPDEPAAAAAPPRAASAWEERMNRGWRRAKREQGTFVDLLRTQVPRVVFLLVPLYGVLLALVYRNRRRPLPAHLVFALHAHAFVFLALTIPQLFDAIRLPKVANLADFAAMVWLVLYFPLALRRAYGGRWWPTIVRMIAAGTLYLAAAMAVGFVFMVYMAWVFGGTT